MRVQATWQRPCSVVAITLLACIVVTGAYAQRSRFPQPPPPAVKEEGQPQQEHTQRLDLTGMDMDARELSTLAATVPGDVTHLRQGMLPKGLIDKLKRIERLSRQLRSRIQR